MWVFCCMLGDNDRTSSLLISCNVPWYMGAEGLYNSKTLRYGAWDIDKNPNMPQDCLDKFLGNFGKCLRWMCRQKWLKSRWPDPILDKNWFKMFGNLYVFREMFSGHPSYSSLCFTLSVYICLGVSCAAKNSEYHLLMPDPMCRQNLCKCKAKSTVWTELWRFHADKNGQILRFWDQAFDLNFPGPLTTPLCLLVSRACLPQSHLSQAQGTQYSTTYALTYNWGFVIWPSCTNSSSHHTVQWQQHFISKLSCMACGMW